jgi:hypothetical protein
MLGLPARQAQHDYFSFLLCMIPNSHFLLFKFPQYFYFNNNCFCYPVMNCTSIIINKILQKSKTKF